jgi:DnaJ-class molecular chaperone
LAPYRELFGLPIQYTEAQLKANYRSLAAKYHPDHNGTSGGRKKQNAEDMMKKINEGYEILKKNIEG